LVFTNLLKLHIIQKLAEVGRIDSEIIRQVLLRDQLKDMGTPVEKLL
jgi:hypothetical protein